MSDSRSLISSAFIMLVACFFSFLLVYIFGTTADTIIFGLKDSVSLLIPEKWQTDIGLYRSLLYITCLMPAITGVLQFILASSKRLRYDAPKEQPGVGYDQEYLQQFEES